MINIDETEKRFESEYDIFISYRRLNSQGQIEGRDIARLLAKELKLHGYSVFFDYSEIKDGDFDRVILPAVRSCVVFLLILTPDSLTRCSNEGDWVTREILEAKRGNSKIITVDPSYSFTSFPDDLPQDLNFIKTIQRSSIDMESNFEITVEKMVRERIRPFLPGVSIPHEDNGGSPFVILKFGERLIELPDVFFNKHVYSALKRSYE